MKKHRFFLLSFSILFLVLAGCGNKVKLGGKVSFPDGEPLGSGTIYFSNDDYLARAYIRSDGTYDVGSLKEHDGLPPGKYKVFFPGWFKRSRTQKTRTVK